MVTTIHKEGSSDSQYELHRPLVSKPSQLTRVTVSDPMYRCWACGQVLRLLFILPLIIALSLFIEVSVPSQESEWSCICVLLYRFYLFLRFCIGFWNCTDSVVSLFFILFEKGYDTKSLYFLQVMNSEQCKIIYVKSGTFSIFICLSSQMLNK